MMKTSLDHLPARKRADLDRIVETLLDAFDAYCARGTQSWRKAGRIEKIVLFGSFARGGWVFNPATGYLSDYDILIVVNNPKLTEPEVWDTAEDRLIPVRARFDHPTSLIVHTMQELNGFLSDGQYFFTDIIDDGVLLYHRKGSSGFAKPKKMSAEKALQYSTKYFAQWLLQAKEFLQLAELGIGNGMTARAAFVLHQATESAYICQLLTKTHYTPATHNLRHLRSLSGNVNPELLEIWSDTPRLHKRAFERLKDAYIHARYSEHYQITDEELAYLVERIGVLIEAVSASCQDHMAKLERKVGKS